MTQQRQQYVALIAKAKAAREPILNELRKQVESVSLYLSYAYRYRVCTYANTPSNIYGIETVPC